MSVVKTRKPVVERTPTGNKDPESGTQLKCTRVKDNQMNGYTIYVKGDRNQVMTNSNKFQMNNTVTFP